MKCLKILYGVKATALLDKWLQVIEEMNIYDENGVTKYDWVCFAPRYRYYYEQVRALIKTLPFLNCPISDSVERAIIGLKEPSMIKYLSNLKTHIASIRSMLNIIQKPVSSKLKLLKSFEFNRIDEAVCCYHANCYNATVGMAVTAIENRLLNMLEKNNVSGEKKLKDMTLGAKIGEYLKNKKNYNDCVPKRHEPLLDLCNTYRIFSVHPKKTNISKRIAESILNLTFEFLSDRKTVI